MIKIKLKTPQEIGIMQEAGDKLKKVIADLLPQIRPGITTLLINAQAEALINKYGGESSFSKVKNYKWATCLPINEQAVHTPPSERVLKDGDVLTVDIGLYYKGFHTDFATSFIVGNKKNKEVVRFLEVGKMALTKALGQVKSGNHLGEISQVIRGEIEKGGYRILKNLTGHGIGRDLHEDPFVPQFLDRRVEQTYKMRPGLVLAVEVIYCQSSQDISPEKGSDWSIVSRDGSLTACFEHTVAITDRGPIIIT